MLRNGLLSAGLLGAAAVSYWYPELLGGAAGAGVGEGKESLIDGLGSGEPKTL